jgi:hypothetical protein
MGIISLLYAEGEVVAQDCVLAKEIMSQALAADLTQAPKELGTNIGMFCN